MNKLLLAAAGSVVVVVIGGICTIGQAQQTGGGQFPVPVAKSPANATPPVLAAPPDLPKAPVSPPPSTAAIFGAGGNNSPGTNAKANVMRGLDGQPLGLESDKFKALREFLSQNFDAPDPNADIDIRNASGNGVICVHWYSGKDAAQMAREMAFELRNNPQYKLSAYTYRKGVDECKSEQARVRKEMARQQERYESQQALGDVPLRLPWIHYEIQYAVLVGGYKDMKAAAEDLNRIRHLPAPDPTRVKLHMEMVLECDANGMPKDGIYSPVNPFKSSIISSNPNARTQQAIAATAEDLALLKQLNAGETFSLANCRGKYSLAVKQFSLSTTLATGKSNSTWLEKLGIGGSHSTVDAAALNAHNLADLLIKSKYEAYVWHTKYCSFVTVGSYDNPEDPRIVRDQQALLQFNQHLHPSVQLAPGGLMAVPK